MSWTCPPWDPRVVAGMEMHQCQCSAWGLPCPTSGEGTRGQRRDLAGAAREHRDHQLSSARDDGVPCERSPGTGLPGWGGLSRVKAAGFSSASPTGEEQTDRGETWGTASSPMGLAGPTGPVHTQGSWLLRSCREAWGCPACPSSASSARARERFISSKWIPLMNQFKSRSIASSQVPSHRALAVTRRGGTAPASARRYRELLPVAASLSIGCQAETTSWQHLCLPEPAMAPWYLLGTTAGWATMERAASCCQRELPQFRIKPGSPPRGLSCLFPPSPKGARLSGLAKLPGPRAATGHPVLLHRPAESAGK